MGGTGTVVHDTTLFTNTIHVHVFRFLIYKYINRSIKNNLLLFMNFEESKQYAKQNIESEIAQLDAILNAKRSL